jgi:hypothetical protein
MSKADECRQNAEDALRWAANAKTEEEKAAYLNLSSVWMQVALQAEGALVQGHKPPEHRATL